MRSVAVFPLRGQYFVDGTYKNITAKMQGPFDTGEEFKQLQRTWNFLVQAQTTTEYDCQLIAMRVVLLAYVMRYLEDTWLVYKKMFVSCYLFGCLYYGHVPTSCVESAHVAVKKWLNGSTDK